MPMIPQARKLPSQARSRHAVAAILEAAARILERDGYAGLTTNKAAELAGVGIGSLYQYFPNKQALVAALHRRHGEETLAAVREALRLSAGLPWPAQLEQLVSACLRLHLAAPGLHRVLEREWPQFDAPPADNPLDAALLDCVAEWLAGGGLPVERAPRLLRMADSLIHGLALDGAPDEAELTRCVAAALTAYLALPWQGPEIST
ncbi:AcrR family transcriptional regulator [Chromobacterium alkanivorans]|uniref:TetR/AcrR family transcriptional regulator n=1 Tax=Chromobacterium alkanivorans TaxID=1071719 RepID=UPI00216758CA|nr:TetR/AcrR family transcriptional regulator [Chromobacterium alkanivorans]MCS3803538.1 AcrR family transcriptional regulator [Chromobacterium alkanivorans]MCS3817352.1 AcrR family transcriptional regulator [Chromobacterium alkanivorans]MCS3872904.1 AcrR family transcriptional regulator [Chromobacterium alkanivorans]